MEECSVAHLAGPCPRRSLAVHRVRFTSPAWTERQAERGHLEAEGLLAWDGLPGLGLVVS